VALVLPGTVSPAAETNGCHCFRNRNFNPSDTFSSDEFLLTTTFNSLLASEFGISKRQIIMMKMQEGVANNDLVTALYISQKTGTELSWLLKERKQKSWHDILAGLQVKAKSPGIENLLRILETDATDSAITEHITALIIASRFAPPEESLAHLRKSGLNDREIVLACTLSSHTGVPVETIAAKHTENGLSWSEIAHNFGLEPAGVGKIVETGKDQKK